MKTYNNKLFSPIHSYQYTIQSIHYKGLYTVYTIVTLLFQVNGGKDDEVLYREVIGLSSDMRSASTQPR